MKKWIIKGIVLSLFMGANAQALTRSQHDTAVGAVLGGVAGAIVGNDVTSTMAGAALGGVVGSQWNAHKEEKNIVLSVKENIAIITKASALRVMNMMISMTATTNHIDQNTININHIITMMIK